MYLKKISGGSCGGFAEANIIDIGMSFGDFAMYVLPGKKWKKEIRGEKGGVTNVARAENF